MSATIISLTVPELRNRNPEADITVNVSTEPRKRHNTYKLLAAIDKQYNTAYLKQAQDAVRNYLQPAQQRTAQHTAQRTTQQPAQQPAQQPQRATQGLTAQQSKPCAPACSLPQQSDTNSQSLKQQKALHERTLVLQRQMMGLQNEIAECLKQIQVYQEQINSLMREYESALSQLYTNYKPSRNLSYSLDLNSKPSKESRDKQIVALFNQGYTYRQIVETLGVSNTTIQKAIKQSLAAQQTPTNDTNHQPPTSDNNQQPTDDQQQQPPTNNQQQAHTHISQPAAQQATKSFEEAWEQLREQSYSEAHSQPAHSQPAQQSQIAKQEFMRYTPNYLASEPVRNRTVVPSFNEDSDYEWADPYGDDDFQPADSDEDNMYDCM